MKRTSATSAYAEGIANAVRRPASTETDDDPSREQIVDWLTRLRNLYGIPFQYLIPDTRMLPSESIRFFRVDENWMTCVLDGAFSIGASTAGVEAEREARTRLHAEARARAPLFRARRFGRSAGRAALTEPLSGFLLRSAAVAMWPGMEIKLYREDGSRIANLLRFDRVSGGVFFCIAEGAIARATFSEPAESLHFGVALPQQSGDPYRKRLKYVDGDGTHQPGEELPESADVDVPFRDPARRVVDIDALRTVVDAALRAHGAIDPSKKFSSAEFALEMVQGVQEVDFEVLT